MVFLMSEVPLCQADSKKKKQEKDRLDASKSGADAPAGAQPLTSRRAFAGPHVRYFFFFFITLEPRVG